jgi:acetylcholinesterase
MDTLGDCDDEGTLFSLSTSNITTDGEFYDYLHALFLSEVPQEDLRDLTYLYPSNLTLGSPFNTGSSNALTPQFKRIAAFQGDTIFQAPRRLFLQQLSGKQNIWSYCTYYHETSIEIRH